MILVCVLEIKMHIQCTEILWEQLLRKDQRNAKKGHSYERP